MKHITLSVLCKIFRLYFSKKVRRQGMSTSTISTPVSISICKKRELSSPEEIGEAKKNKLSSVSSSDSSILAEPSTPVTINMKEGSGTVADGDVISHGVISLTDSDIQKIGVIVTDTFKTQISDLVTSVVNGVIAGLKSTISSLEKENSDLRKKVVDLEGRADAAEQYSRRNSLRVAGILEETNEDIDKIIHGLASTLNVDMELADIDRSHRVGRPGPGKQRDIIVKFVSYRTRRKLYGVRVQTKSKELKGVFINEDLTRVRSRILSKARRMVKNKHISSAWTSDGTILVRDKLDRIHRIQTETDLSNYGPVPNDY